MRVLFDGFNDVVRLDKGERLAAALEQLGQNSDLPGGWLSGLGGAQSVTLGFYHLDKKEYTWQTFDGLREVLSLTGNVARGADGQFICHLHGVFGDAQSQTIGGHVKDLTVAATLELFLHRTYKPLSRKLNTEVGLPLLEV